MYADKAYTVLLRLFLPLHYTILFPRKAVRHGSFTVSARILYCRFHAFTFPNEAFPIIQHFPYSSAVRQHATKTVHCAGRFLFLQPITNCRLLPQFSTPYPFRHSCRPRRYPSFRECRPLPHRSLDNLPRPRWRCGTRSS